MSSADNLCEQFGPPDQAQLNFLSDLKLNCLHILIVLLKIVYENVNIRKEYHKTTKKHAKLLKGNIPALIIFILIKNKFLINY